MSASVPSVEQMIEGFQYPELTKIDGKPNYNSLAIINRELITNALSIHCKLGGGTHGYRALLVSDEAYSILSATEFDMPKHPGDEPVYANNANAAVKSNLLSAH